jgi:DNA topoisomerase IB
MRGPVRFPMGTCKPSAPMRPAAVNTSITRHGGCDATYRSSAGSNGFAEALPGLRATCDASLRRRGLHREKSLALAIRLLDEGSFRLGSEAYARDNGTSPRDDPRRPRADRGLAHHVRLHGEEREAACSDDRRRRLIPDVRATGRLAVVKGVAEHLGNTPAVCRASYIDPRGDRSVPSRERPSRTRSAVSTSTLRSISQRESGSSVP